MRQMEDTDLHDRVMADFLNRLHFLDGDRQISPEDVRRNREANRPASQSEIARRLGYVKPEVDLHLYSVPPWLRLRHETHQISPSPCGSDPSSDQKRRIKEVANRMRQARQACSQSLLQQEDQTRTEIEEALFQVLLQWRSGRRSPCSRPLAGWRQFASVARILCSWGFLSIDGLACGNSILAGLRTPTNNAASVRIIVSSSLAIRRPTALGLFRPGAIFFVKPVSAGHRRGDRRISRGVRHA